MSTTTTFVFNTSGSERQNTDTKKKTVENGTSAKEHVISSGFTKSSESGPSKTKNSSKVSDKKNLKKDKVQSGAQAGKADHEGTTREPPTKAVVKMDWKSTSENKSRTANLNIKKAVEARHSSTKHEKVKEMSNKDSVKTDPDISAELKAKFVKPEVITPKDAVDLFQPKNDSSFSQPLKTGSRKLSKHKHDKAENNRLSKRNRASVHSDKSAETPDGNSAISSFCGRLPFPVYAIIVALYHRVYLLWVLMLRYIFWPL